MHSLNLKCVCVCVCGGGGGGGGGGDIKIQITQSVKYSIDIKPQYNIKLTILMLSPRLARIVFSVLFRWLEWFNLIGYTFQVTPRNGYHSIE